LCTVCLAYSNIIVVVAAAAAVVAVLVVIIIVIITGGGIVVVVYFAVLSNCLYLDSRVLLFFVLIPIPLQGVKISDIVNLKS